MCYAGRTERQYKNVKTAVDYNFDLLKNASATEMAALLSEMIDDFRKDCVRRSAVMKFRIHWDGDFFSVDYAKAWASVISTNSDIQFWAYTRTFLPTLNVVPVLAKLENLALFLSVDSANVRHAVKVFKAHEKYGVKIATLASTTDESKEFLLKTTGKVGAACPENIKRIPLITPAGGACFTCALCTEGKASIRFASSHKEN